MFIDLKEREREREKKKRERERERERDIDWLPPIYTLTRDPTHKPGMCPDWESNLQLFFPLVYGMVLQPTEPPGQCCSCLLIAPH